MTATSVHGTGLVALCLIASLLLVSCASEKSVILSRAGDASPLSKTDLQALIDGAPDGGTVRIPLARYILRDGLRIDNRVGLTIDCEPGAQIYVDDISADVVTIENARDIVLRGAFLQHFTPAKDYECHGAVLVVRNSQNVTVENCELDGSGAVGVLGGNCDTLTVQRCLIRHNSFNAFYLSDCSTVRVYDNIIEENANFLQAYALDDVDMSGNIIRNNGGYWREPGKAGLEN